jgi:hypothetical protein
MQATIISNLYHPDTGLQDGRLVLKRTGFAARLGGGTAGSQMYQQACILFIFKRLAFRNRLYFFSK